MSATGHAGFTIATTRQCSLASDAIDAGSQCSACESPIEDDSRASVHVAEHARRGRVLEQRAPAVVCHSVVARGGKQALFGRRRVGVRRDSAPMREQRGERHSRRTPTQVTSCGRDRRDRSPRRIGSSTKRYVSTARTSATADHASFPATPISPIERRAESDERPVPEIPRVRHAPEPAQQRVRRVTLLTASVGTRCSADDERDRSERRKKRGDARIRHAPRGTTTAAIADRDEPADLQRESRARPASATIAMRSSAPRCRRARTPRCASACRRTPTAATTRVSHRRGGERDRARRRATATINSGAVRGRPCRRTSGRRTRRGAAR